MKLDHNRCKTTLGIAAFTLIGAGCCATMTVMSLGFVVVMFNLQRMDTR